MGGSRGGTGGSDPPPLKNRNTIGLQPYWPGSPEKSQGYKASIQCWAINGTTVNSILMAFAGGPMSVRLWWYLDRLSPRQLRKKGCQSRIPSGKTFWIRVRCENSSEEPSLWTNL